MKKAKAISAGVAPGGPLLPLALLTLLPFLIAACASLERVTPPVPPEVRLRSVRLAAIDFSRADLLAEFSVENPNNIGVDMSGFSWALAVEGEPFLSGEQREGIRIDAGGESVVQVPFYLAFREALEVVQATRELRELVYAVDLVVMLDIPVLGPREVPLHHEGTVPVPRIPVVSFQSMTLDSITFTGAELSLRVAVDNPNLFGLALEEFAYSFSVRDRPWVEGRTSGIVLIGPEGEGEIVIPVSLRFLEVGRSVYQLLTGGGQLEYRLEVDALARPDFDLFPPVAINPVVTGMVPISR